MTRGAEPWDLKLHVVRKNGDPETAMASTSKSDTNEDEEPASAPPCQPDNDPKKMESVAEPENDQKQAPTDGPKTARKAVVRVDQRTKDGGSVYTQTLKRSAWKISSKYALVVRQVFDYDGSLSNTLIDVRAQGLRDVLQDILKGAEGLQLNEKPPMIQPKLLYHCAPKLRLRLKDELAKEKKDNDLVFEIEAALQVVNEDFAKDEENVQSLLRSGRITFDTLWAIVPPNELVYTRDLLSEPCVYRAVNSGVWKNSDGSVVFYILGRMVDSNGETLGWTKSTTLEIPIFTGEKTITDLPVYPLRLHSKSAQMRRQLLERGQRRIRLQKHGFYEYSGSAVQETETPLGLTRKERFSCRGRIVIDPAAFSEIEPENGFVPEIRHAISEDKLSDDELVAMPSVVYGFSLTEKTWGAFAVSRITEIEWNTSVWDSLVLPDASKRLVRTLVKSHVSHNSSFDDFVRGKGRGLVGLLAGPPGVGKTLTAEAVAETVQRPLYMLSSGELGSDPDSIDQRLQRVFRLAQTWKAVLLLDEADVFMAKRTDANLTRNAIVSIFLRQLEYYQGILILTTNRVEKIDDAFRSRIHFQLSFPELDSAARKAIWHGFLGNTIKNGGAAIDLDELAVDRLAKMKMNGRQIKNVMKMSQLFAADENRPLVLEDILLVAEMSRTCLI
ncbi:hypothetical protein MFIFM68171_04691 [Madurella fahalii]|uniref:AAA+ ATPase domain-containing protein n=1 Tax=Madurella fahalii TaxID=1157608 RepID=A0ABQ0G9S2_9PEZI